MGIKENSFWGRLKDPINLFTCILSISTIGLLIVSYLQWRTLDKTDKTLRTGERAFVYLDDVHVTAYKEKWDFEPAATNSGSTQTVDFVYILKCGPPVTELGLQSSIIGPKQSKILGECVIPIHNLDLIWINHGSVEISGSIFYKDTFSASHWTKFCRQIRMPIDPKTITGGQTIPRGMGPCPNAPDCADGECKP
jgi:hypothetical protein